MANLNKVFLIGNLTRDPELRTTPSGLPITEFGLAVNRIRRGNDGQEIKEVTFVDITAFGKQAETLKQYMAKGKPIFIEGRLRLEQWTSKEGQKRSKLSVVVEGFQFLGAPGGGAGGGGGPRQAAEFDGPPADDDYGGPRSEGDENIPF